jgi:AraC family transcriptional regulator of adaptative response/methylated-DNA-[protein]-cysteine methyltransferase
MSEMQTSSGQGISGHAAARYWQATLARDSRADGTFVLAVRSTHIYCRPSCPARRPLRRNVVFFHTREEAEKQGYRACRRCRPNELPGAVVLVGRAVRHLADSTEESVRLGVLASVLNTTQGTLRRAFRQVTGLKPRELAEALRIRKFKAMLRSGRNITDALYETGYGSSSRVYEATRSLA